MLVGAVLHVHACTTLSAPLFLHKCTQKINECLLQGLREVKGDVCKSKIHLKIRMYFKGALAGSSFQQSPLPSKVHLYRTKVLEERHLDQRGYAQETSKVVFLKNVYSGAEGERKEYCWRRSVLDIKRWMSLYLCSDCQSGCLWKGILTALTSKETNYLNKEMP